MTREELVKNLLDRYARVITVDALVSADAKIRESRVLEGMADYQDSDELCLVAGVLIHCGMKLLRANGVEPRDEDIAGHQYAVDAMRSVLRAYELGRASAKAEH